MAVVSIRGAFLPAYLRPPIECLKAQPCESTRTPIGQPLKRAFFTRRLTGRRLT